MPQQGGINAPYTRLRGPLLVGQSSDFGIAAVNGGSTAPLISFYNASEYGYFVNSSNKVSFATPSGAMVQYTSDYMSVGTTSLLTTSNTDDVPYLVIPVSSGNLSSAALPSALNGMAALVWAQSTVTPGGKGALWVYTTRSTGWMASTMPAFTSTTTGPA